MKKVRLLTTLIFSSLLIAGCSTELSNNSNLVEDPINTIEYNLNIREKLLNQYEWIDINSLDEDNKILYDMIKYPLCEQPEVIPGSPRMISDVVENCTQKKKTWDYVDGYGWIFPYWYTYDSNTDQILLLEFISDYYNPDYYGNGFDNKIEKICTYISDWNFMYGKIMTWDDYWLFLNAPTIYSGGMDAIYNVLKKGFLVRFPYSIEPSLCKEWDPDCETMYSVWAWSDDEWNYFVAWKIPFYWNGYYLINDYVLNPWHSDDISYYDTNDNLSWRSKRYFWWIKNDRIIVKRFLDYRSTWKSIQYNDDSWYYYRIGSEFTLETCEIPFSKLENNKMKEMVN